MAIQSMIFCGLLGSVLGCQSVTSIDNVNRPYGVIRASVKESLPGGVRKISANAREYDSYYFAPKGPLDVDAERARVRESAHIMILGPGRPYEITVEVTIETRTSSGYEKTGHDYRRAAEIARLIQTGLSNRRDDRNMIDDIKPF